MLREALPEVQALGYTNDAFSQQVRTMAVAKLLNMRHSKHDRVNFVSAKYSDPTVIPKFVPAIPLEKLPRTIAEPKLPTRGRPPGVTSRRISATVHPEPLRAAPATGMPLPTASIDIVRSTGRIRIAVGGIAIEVGLVDE